VNWKASLLGALLVAVCGAAVGVAIGGKTKTHVRTVTTTVSATTLAAQTGTTTSDSGTASTTSSITGTSSTTSATTTTTSTGTETSAEAGQQEYLAEYLSSQESSKLNANASNVSLSSEPSKEELQGQTYQQAVVFDINNDDNNSTATFQMPVPGFSHLSSKAVGLETSASAETYYTLTVYKNNDTPSSTILYQANFQGPSEVHKMSFALQGATDLLFVWAKKASANEQDAFILADPVLTR
jgi:hypothetical protein